MEIVNWTIYEPDYQWFKYRINDGKQHSIEKIKLKEYLDLICIPPSRLTKALYCIDTSYPFILYEFDNKTFDIEELTYKQSPEEFRKEFEMEIQSKQSIIKNREKEIEKEKPSLIEKLANKLLFSEDPDDEDK